MSYTPASVQDVKDNIQEIDRTLKTLRKAIAAAQEYPDSDWVDFVDRCDDFAIELRDLIKKHQL